jgi:hypothetical protein
MPMTLKKVLAFIETTSGAEDCEEIMKALKAKGVSTRGPNKPRAKKVNVKTDFNPDLCHARDFESTDHEKFGKKGNASNKRHHLSLFDFQCCGKKQEGTDYCSRHKSGSKTNRCQPSDELLMGDFTDPRPENPTRDSGSSAAVNKYVWLEDMDGDYDEFLSEKKTKKKTVKKTEKKTEKSDKKSGKKSEKKSDKKSDKKSEKKKKTKKTRRPRLSR